MVSSGQIDVDRIRQRARELWEQDGRPEGRDTHYWFKAEAELKQQDQSGLDSPLAGGSAGSASGRPGPDIVASDEPAAAARPSRGRGGKKAKPDSVEVQSADAEEESASASKEVSEERGRYVQQRRTRKKTEG